jgi:hypothetical protein
MIIEQAAKHGLPLPEKIQNAPSLLPGLELYYIGFTDLINSRNVGMGVSPIWWGTIQDYCDRKKLDEEQTEAMHHHIKAMDGVYLNLSQKKK